jgi:hypothetical protein
VELMGIEPTSILNYLKYLFTGIVQKNKMLI